MNDRLPAVPLIDLGCEPVISHVVRRQEQALAVREACLGWLPLGGLLARLADPIVRNWMRRSATPYAADIDAVARLLKRPGVWLLHGAYLFGCTALADETVAGPRLRRTLDWPFPGLGRLVEVVRRQGPAGEFLNVTWPGFIGVLTAMAPGRFAASINQAPMRCRSTHAWLLWLDYALNAIAAICGSGRIPPEHLLRRVFETCRDFHEAQHLLESVPIARPALFVLVGCRPGEHVVIERECTASRTRSTKTIAANAWQHPSDSWRPRVCGDGTPEENNRRRIAALAEWRGRDVEGLGWASAPVVNAFTRLAVEACPSTGSLQVAGWEDDARGGAAPVTAATVFRTPALPTFAGSAGFQ